jgi:hypothetical protein
MNRIDLPKHLIDKALAMLRKPEPITATAEALGIDHQVLRSNLRRAGLLDEFKGRTFHRQPDGAQVRASWDEGMNNRRLIMKLRQQP